VIEPVDDEFYERLFQEQQKGDGETEIVRLRRERDCLFDYLFALHQGMGFSAAGAAEKVEAILKIPKAPVAEKAPTDISPARLQARVRQIELNKEQK
jgi:hypothetical protein